MCLSSIRLVVACAAVAGAALTARDVAAAQPRAGTGGPERELERARAAYDRGVRANAAKDYAAAAKAFAEADALAPAAASLEAALEATMKADAVALGAELVERADGRAPDAGLRSTLEAARRRFAGRSGKIRVECPGDTRCLAAVDGAAAADARKLIVVAVGPHAVVVQRGDERTEKLVEVKADGVVVVEAGASPTSATSPAPPLVVTGPGPAAGAEDRPPLRAEASSGISPNYFWIGLGITAVAGAFTVVSGIDAKGLHDRFASDGCATGSGPVPADCGSRSQDGASAQRRTNVLLGATAVLGAGTAVLGLFVVRWKDGTQGRVTVGGAHGVASAGLELVTP